MKIIVKAKTKARIAKVERVSQPELGFDSADRGALVIYKVAVKEAPVAGQANEAIIRALAEYFATARSRIRLVSGQTSKQKIFEIEN